MNSGVMRVRKFVTFGLIIMITVGMTAGIASAQDAEIVGYKFFDYNKNGHKDGNGFFLEDWEITLAYDNGTVIDTRLTDEYGQYNFSGLDPYFNYTVTETVKPGGWFNTTPTSYDVSFITGLGPSDGPNEIFTTEEELNARMYNIPYATAYVWMGYNIRIGMLPQQDEFQIFEPLGDWNPGQSSDPLSPGGNVVWTSGDYRHFNETWTPSEPNGNMSIDSQNIVQNVCPCQGARSNSRPINDIIIRLHSERTYYWVEVNNLTLKQGNVEYELVNKHMNWSGSVLPSGQDQYLLLRASNALTSAGGQAIYSGGFSLDGDIRFYWSSGDPTGNTIKMDVYVGNYRSSYEQLETAIFGNHINGTVSGYKLDTANTGLDDWNITITNTTLEFFGYNRTDTNGYYEIHDVPPGFFALNESLGEKPGWTPVEGNRTILTNLTTLDLYNQNFTNMMTGNISGYKLNETGYGLSGWNISVFNSTTDFFGYNLTNDTGYYIIRDVPLNSYWLNETLQAGWAQITGNRTVEINETVSDLYNQNFTNAWNNGTISGFKLNESGYGLSGWTIELYNSTGYSFGSTLTNATGFYNFTSLQGDIYNVTEVLQGGWNNTTPLYIDGLVLDETTSPITDVNFTNQWENGLISGYKLNETGYGLSGWTIELYNSTGYSFGSTTTNATGFYNFTDLQADTYNVSETLELDWINLGPLYIAGLELNEATSPIMDVNFTNQWTNGTLEGYKLNETGYGLSGWTINLENSTGYSFGSTATNATGYYNFTGLLSDTYNVSEVLQVDWTNITPLYISGLVINNETTPIISDLNFTNSWGNGTISGYKLNESGYGLSGWTINLENSTGYSFGSTLTNATGFYNFTSLQGDTYNVTEVLQGGWNNTTPLYVDGLVLDETTSPITDVNFTNQWENGLISGYKLNESGYGLSGWTINLENSTGYSFGSTLTNATGFYNFTNLQADSYNVSEVLEADWTNLSPLYIAGLELTEVTSPIMYQNFTNQWANGTLEGYKLNATGEGLSGWTINLENSTGYSFGSTVTDATGYYNFTGLLSDTYNVSEVLQFNYINISPLYINGLVLNNETSPVISDLNFTNRLICGYINGYKLNETGYGLSGWTINLYNETAGSYMTPEVTDGDGFYNFTLLRCGCSYNVSEVQQNGYNAIPPLFYSGLEINQTTQFHTDRNFTNERIVGYINGYKRDETGTGLSGWTINLYNQTGGDTFVTSQLTGSDGFYNFTGLEYGITYNVSEVQQSWYTAIPPTFYNGLEINDTFQYHTDRNFTNQEKLGYINGYKIWDETGDGLSGWTINLYNQTGGTFIESTLTDVTGFYNFTGLKYGTTYNVSEDMEPHWIPVGPTIINDLAINDGTPFHEDQNFTNDPYPYGNITGYKLSQGDNVGQQGWTITLYNATTGNPVASTATDQNGRFEFLNIPFGPYWLNETPQSGWEQITPNLLFDLDIDNYEVTYNFINTQLGCCECPTVAHFSWKRTASRTIQFTDETTGNPVQYYWRFGDGASSTDPNPTHVYPRSATYIVILYVKGADCSGKVDSTWASYYQRVTVT
jgi:protocatechuate 3,4-dioxygenase beta subunit